MRCVGASFLNRNAFIEECLSISHVVSRQSSILNIIRDACGVCLRASPPFKCRSAAWKFVMHAGPLSPEVNWSARQVECRELDVCGEQLRQRHAGAGPRPGVCLGSGGCFAARTPACASAVLGQVLILACFLGLAS